jgi:hypothetical protein
LYYIYQNEQIDGRTPVDLLILDSFVCAGGDLNPHGLRHMALNHACLPIPAPAREQWYYNRLYCDVKKLKVLRIFRWYAASEGFFSWRLPRLS